MMEFLWIYAAGGAALCQALRYAALKELNRHLSTLVSTYVRILFSFPLQLVYVLALYAWLGLGIPSMSAWFVLCSAITAAGQFLGTALMVRLFQIGNFAVGTMLAKSDVIMTAVIGTVLFNEVISRIGWVALLITAAGVMLTSAGRFPASAWKAGGAGPMAVLFGPATRIGLLSGLLNALSYQFLKEAITALDPELAPAARAAWAGLSMSLCSVVMLGGWLLLTERDGLKRIARHQGAAWFLGLMSAAGTIMWYLASSMTNASYVAAVAQVQVVFSLALSRYWFGERIRPLELAGIVTIVGGILLFKLA
jgi:drug/metabolite transporter (DMT)-like permease